MSARYYILMLLLLAGSLTQAQVLTLQTPVKGDSWPGYSIQKISWTSDNVDNIKIESSLDSGRTWSMVISSYPASAQFYEWEVPNKVSDSCFIRITDVQNSSVSSSNFRNNPFKIPVPGITVDSLLTVVQAGAVLPVYWTASGIRRIHIFLSKDNRISYSKVADSISATTFYYNLPMLVAGANYHIKIIDAQDPSLSGNAPENFSVIQSPLQTNTKFRGGAYDGAASSSNKLSSLSFVAPLNNDSGYLKDGYRIQWKFDNVDKINLYFSADGGSNWKVIDSNYNAQAGVFDWVIPDTVTQTGKIKIENTSEPTVQAVSAGNFIVLPKKIKIIAPDSSLTAYRQSVLQLQWIKGGVNKVKINIRTRQKDSVWVKDIPADAESFNLPINAEIPDSFRVVIADMSDSTVNDSTALIVVRRLPAIDASKFKGGAFDGYAGHANITPRLALTNPGAGDTVSVSSKQNIGWTAINVDRINIDLSTDNGSNWVRVSTDVPASAGLYEWRTPVTPSNQCLLRIWDSFDSSVVAVSNATFVLAPKTIRNTTDSLNWTKGLPKAIEWTSRGVDTIRLQYKTGYDRPWVLIADKIPASYETINWIVPAIPGDSLFVLINDAADTSVKDEKVYAGPFRSIVQNQDPHKFRGGSFDGHSQKSNISRIIVQKPAENEVVVSGSIYTIQWSTVNLEDSILLQLSIDSGKTWVNIARALASAGQYAWQIPATLSTSEMYGSNPTRRVDSKDGRALLGANSTKCLLRAIDLVSGNEVVGISSKPFTISSTAPKIKPAILFPEIRDTGFVQPLVIKLKTSTDTGSTVKYIFQGSNATRQGDSLLVTAPGTINIKVFAQSNSDSSNRSDTISRSFCINPPKPVLNLKDSVTIYTNDSVQLASNTLYGHQWYRNNQPIGGATTTKLITTQPGIYTDTAVVNGCFAGSASVLVIVKAIPARPTIEFPAIPDTLFKNSLLLRLKASASPGSTVRFIYQGTTAQLHGDSLIVTTPGTIVVAAFAQSNTNADNRSDTITRTFCVNPPKPVLNLKDSVSFCSRDSVQLVTDAAYGHKWYRNGQQVPGAVSSKLIVSQSGVYSDTVQVNSCYAGSENLIVTEKPRPDTPTISSSATNLMSSNADRYQWYLNNQTITSGTNKIQAIIAKGYYKVEVSKNNCWAVSKPFLVQADPISLDQNEFVLKAYPNPAGSQFYLLLEFDKRITSYVDINITDINGAAVWKGRRMIFNSQRVTVPIFARLAKGSNMVQVIVNGYKTKTVQIVSLQ